MNVIVETQWSILEMGGKTLLGPDTMQSSIPGFASARLPLRHLSSLNFERFQRLKVTFNVANISRRGIALQTLYR
jgi:hypothetical protein